MELRYTQITLRKGSRRRVMGALLLFAIPMVIVLLTDRRNNRHQLLLPNETERAGRVNGLSRSYKSNFPILSNSDSTGEAKDHEPFLEPVSDNFSKRQVDPKSNTGQIEYHIIENHDENHLIGVGMIGVGMINVTDNENGYRITFFSQEGSKNIGIAFDPLKIPQGYTVHDVYTYRFNEASNNWEQLKRDGIDFDGNKIHSTSSKDGEFINAIIKVPEAPETQGYAPTTLSDIKVGDPASMVQIIQPPVANNQGTANLSYHIETLPGRGGIQPDLNITYNSDGGNGWMGEGWSLSGISSITVDTRWGVPKYDKQKETETYLLDGQMLAIAESGKTPHRSIDIPRSPGKTAFTERKQSSFNLIEREGSEPWNYRWIITDKSGTKFFYGWDGTHVENALIRKKNGNPGIAEWKLTRVQDVWGNYMTIFYNKEYPHPEKIEYTRHIGNELSFHRVAFKYSAANRVDDTMINARYGVAVNPNAKRLDEITVERILNHEGNNTEPVRKYGFSYRSGAFGKTLLAKLTQYGDDGSLFNSHEFKYFNEDQKEPFYTKADTVLVNDKGLKGSVPDPLNITNNKTTAIGASKSSSNSASFYFGVGSGSPTSVNISGGIQYNNSSSSSEGINTLIDVDGDGRPDKVFVKDGKLQYEKNVSVGSVVRFDPHSVIIEGSDKFLEESSRTTGWGARANFGMSLSYDKASTETIIKTYFSDVNGDGLMDIVRDGTVLFNTGRRVGNTLYLSPLSSDTPVLINGGTGSSSPTLPNLETDTKELVSNNPLQEVVRVWEAPFDGVVDIDAPVQLVEPGKSECKDPDGVWVAVEHKNGDKTIQIAKKDYRVHPISLRHLDVKKGDLIFFRVQSGRIDEANGECDRVSWSPRISYVRSPVMGMDTTIKEPAVKRYTFQASHDFLVSSPLAIEIPEEITDIQFSGIFKKEKTMDAVTVKVIQLIKDLSKPIKDKNGNDIVDDKGNKIYDFSPDSTPLFIKSYGPDEVTNSLPFSEIIRIPAKDRKIQCIVSSNVNIDLINLMWHPKISYQRPLKLTAFDRSNVPVPGKDTLVSEFIYPVPYYVFNDSLRFSNALYDSSATNSILDFYPLLRVDTAKLNSKYWFAVKSANKVLGKKLITYENGIIKDERPLSVTINKGDPYIVSFEGIEDEIGKLNNAAYQKEIKKINNADYYFKANRTKAHFLKTPLIDPTKPEFVEVLSKEGTYMLVPELSVKNDSTKGSVAIQVWVNKKKLTIKDQDTLISYKRNTFSYPSKYILLKDLRANDTISVQFIYANDTLNKNPELKSEFHLNRLVPAELWVSRINNNLGAMYKGWGQFIYNGMNGRASQKIDPQILRLPDGTGITGAQTENFKNSLNGAYESGIDPAKDENYNRLSAVNVAFSPMFPYGSKNGSYWLGGEDMIFLKSDSISTSRLGIDDVKPFKPFVIQNTFANNTDKSYRTAFAKISNSTNASFSKGALFLTGTKSDGLVNQILDFIDINGDRFPDVVTKSSSKLTNVRGSLIDSKNLGFSYSSKHSSLGLSLGGTTGASRSQQGAVPNDNRQSAAGLVNSEGGMAANQSAGYYIGANGAYNAGSDFANSSWIDMNGDGLPDRIFSQNSTYGLNLGNGEFEAFHLKGIGSISEAKNLALSPGITAGFSIDKNSFSGGAGLSFSGSRANESIQDINGDGLPDIAKIGDDGKLVVTVNTGKSFIEYPSWETISGGGDSYGILADAASFPVGFLPRNPITTPWFNMEKTKFNSSNGVSLGGSFTFGFSLLFIKLVFNPSFNHSKSIGRTIRQIIDINADGYPDILYSTSEEKMEVWLSNLGSTNKLSEVRNPLGGEISIDYNHTDVTENHPGGKWVMSAVTLKDGVEADRAVKTAKFDSKKVFSYSGGKHDRYEREFLGFGKTITTDLEFDESNGKPYRDVVRKYDTDTYYRAGQILEELVRDAQDTLKMYTVTRNKYYDEVVKPVIEDNGGVGKFKRQVGVVFPLLKHTVNGTYEGSATVLWQNKSTYFYEQAKHKKYGYISRFTYKENPKNESDESISYQTRITYEPDDIEHYLIGQPTDVITQNINRDTTYKHDGAEYHKWSGDLVNGLNFNGRRKIKLKINYLKNSVKAITQFQYSSSFGTISRIIRPDGVKIKYEYDKDATVSKFAESRTESLITGVINETRGLTSRTFYDYRYGIPVRSQDINENWINYALDKFGRITRVVGPKECGNAPGGVCQSGKSTIQIVYSIKGTLSSGKNPAAKVQQYMENSTALETINFIDGLNRSVQVKKTADVVNENGTANNAKWTVSGRVNYDAMGRVLESYYPALDNSDGLTFIEKPWDDYVTKFTYDPMDRKQTTKLPKEGIAKVALLDSVVFSKDQRNTIVTTFSANDGLDTAQKREQHFDGSGLLAKEVLYYKSGKANITQLLYDPVHRLEKVVDAGERVTKTSYDHQGNKTLINHPDAGLTKFEYDNAGRLFKKITGNGDSIEYKYDHDRLVQIKYPSHPENDVLYLYSDDTKDPKRLNSANKVIYQEDASGAQSFEYGELGEITTNTRTVIVPFSNKKYTFTTKFVYDTWNRLLSITYPDQETVVYKYNKAGLLSSVTGFKDRNFDNTVKKRFDYISKTTYNRFDQRVQIISNDDKKVTTTFDYEADRRRLALMKIGGISNTSEYFNSFESSYVYDNQNNVRRNTLSKKKGTATSSMVHTYGYDKLNRLDSAGGVWKNATELATYNLGLSYDGMFNLTSRNLTLEAKKTGSPQPTIPHIRYVNNYSYEDTGSHQLTQMKEEIFKKNTPNYNESNTEKYFYDNNGNNTLKSTADKSGNDNVYERKIDWDEENRINAVSVNGYVSQYVYDASGERTVKLSTVEDAVFVNGKFAGDTSSIVSFSLYASPYFSMRNGNGAYTKHIYIGSQRIVSQIENAKAFHLNSNNPVQATPVTCPFPDQKSCKDSRTLEARRDSLNNRMNAVFNRFDFHHETIKPNAFDLPPAFSYDNSFNQLTPTLGEKSDPKPSEQKIEWLNFYYHTNQIGSTSFITDNDAKVVQYVEYMPYGETFMEQRQNYSSQFLFNGKEQDQETGLYYYGARYYDPHTYQWLGVDPMADKYPGLGPYNFVLGNPLRMLDPDGRESEDINKDIVPIKTDNLFLLTFGHYRVGEGKDLHVSTESVDFSGLSKENIKGSKENLSINTLDAGFNFTSKALGKVDLQHVTKDLYTIKPDEYDFNIETQNGFSKRNILTALGFIIHNIPGYTEGPDIELQTRPQSFKIYFHGTIKIPEKK